MLTRFGLTLPFSLLALLLAACDARLPASAPAFEVGPATLEFGYAVVNTRAHLELHVENRLDQPETLTLRIDGENAADFVAPIELPVPAGFSGPLRLSFTPSAPGLRTAALAYSTKSESGAVELRGFGTRPKVSVAERLDFGIAYDGKTRTLRIAPIGKAKPGFGGPIGKAKPGFGGPVK